LLGLIEHLRKLKTLELEINYSHVTHFAHSILNLIKNFPLLENLKLSIYYEVDESFDDYDEFDFWFDQEHLPPNLRKLEFNMHGMMIHKVQIEHLFKSLKMLKRLGTLELSLGECKIKSRTFDQLRYTIQDLPLLQEFSFCNTSSQTIDKVSIESLAKLARAFYGLKNLKQLKIDVDMYESHECEQDVLCEIFKNLFNKIEKKLKTGGDDIRFWTYNSNRLRRGP